MGYSGCVWPYKAFKIGYPRAKSFDWVTNIEYNPAFPIFCPWLTRRPTMMTETNRIAFVMNIDKTNFQFTQFRFKVHNAVKIIAGKANVPTNVPNPLASFVDKSLNLKNENIVTIKILACAYSVMVFLKIFITFILLHFYVPRDIICVFNNLH